MDKQRKQFEEAFKSIFGFDAPEQPAMFSGGSFWMIWQAAIDAAEQAQHGDHIVYANKMVQAEPVARDVRCECCGYMTYHREHLGCIRAAQPPAVAVPDGWHAAMSFARSALAEAIQIAPLDRIPRMAGAAMQQIDALLADATKP